MEYVFIALIKLMPVTSTVSQCDCQCPTTTPFYDVWLDLLNRNKLSVYHISHDISHGFSEALAIFTSDNCLEDSFYVLHTANNCIMGFRGSSFIKFIKSIMFSTGLLASIQHRSPEGFCAGLTSGFFFWSSDWTPFPYFLAWVFEL